MNNTFYALIIIINIGSNDSINDCNYVLQIEVNRFGSILTFKCTVSVQSFCFNAKERHNNKLIDCSYYYYYQTVAQHLHRKPREEGDRWMSESVVNRGEDLI